LSQSFFTICKVNMTLMVLSLG